MKVLTELAALTLCASTSFLPSASWLQLIVIHLYIIVVFCIKMAISGPLCI